MQLLKPSVSMNLEMYSYTGRIESLDKAIPTGIESIRPVGENVFRFIETDDFRNLIAEEVCNEI